MEKPLMTPDSNQRVRLFHFNDFHRRLEPFKSGAGGADRLVGELRLLEADNPHALTINLGDVAGDNTSHDQDHFQPIPELFNRAGVDIMALGNHEFEDSSNGYASLEQGLIKPFAGETLVANVSHSDGRPIAGTKPYTIRQMQNYSIAFIAVVTRDLTSAVFPAAGAALSTLPIEETLRSLVAEVKEKGADAVVLLAHDNLNNVKEMAANVPGIDLAFAAHDHRMTEHPEQVTRADGSKAWVAEADAYGRKVGQADMIFENGQVVDVQGFLHDVDTNSPSDPEALAIKERYQPRPRVKMPEKSKLPTTTVGSFAELAKHFANQEEGPKA
jgi:2',3'-cyclic-nucleotide 2'-phosphodiesterase (5'-nucleotidase family)